MSDCGLCSSSARPTQICDDRGNRTVQALTAKRGCLAGRICCRCCPVAWHGPTISRLGYVSASRSAHARHRSALLGVRISHGLWHFWSLRGGKARALCTDGPCFGFWSRRSRFGHGGCSSHVASWFALVSGGPCDHCFAQFLDWRLALSGIKPNTIEVGPVKRKPENHGTQNGTSHRHWRHLL
jgi:hypothetical protein